MEALAAGPLSAGQAARPAMGPLRVHPGNHHYFADASGKAVFLTGSHTWANFQENAYEKAPSPPPFDFNAFLAFLTKHHHNFFRLWAWENTFTPDVREDTVHYGPPMPYLRPGPELALDGKPKFDLNRFDQSYFDRMRAFVAAARDKGIYASVMLFNGFSIEAKGPGDGDAWRGHYLNGKNNLSGLDGGSNGKVHTLTDPAVTAVQEAYIRKVIDTVNDLDNVLYEITNEDTGGPANTQWQYHIIRFIKDYEKTKPKQHPVGMTVQYTKGDDRVLEKSPADWISPAAPLPKSDGGKVVINDTDHCYYWIGLKADGLAAQRAWVWKTSCGDINVRSWTRISMRAFIRGGTTPAATCPIPIGTRSARPWANRGVTPTGCTLPKRLRTASWPRPAIAWPIPAMSTWFSCPTAAK